MAVAGYLIQVVAAVDCLHHLDLEQQHLGQQQRELAIDSLNHQQAAHHSERFCCG